MKTSASSLILCAALGCAGHPAAADVTARSTTRQTYPLKAAAAHMLEVRDLTGSITVEGYSGSDVQMVIDRTVTAATQEDVRAADREVTLDTSADDSHVRAIVRERQHGVCGEEFDRQSAWFEPPYQVRYDFTLRVPADTRITLCTINQGDVLVSGVRGDFWVHSVNGRITLADVAGSGEAITVNGPVTASFTTTPRAASQLTTLNGAVTLTLPGGASADLQMKTFNGGLFTDFAARTLPDPAPAVLEKRHGLSVYRLNQYARVRIGQGGPTLTLTTLNGDVRVLKAPQQTAPGLTR